MCGIKLKSKYVLTGKSQLVPYFPKTRVNGNAKKIQKVLEDISAGKKMQMQLGAAEEIIINKPIALYIRIPFIHVYYIYLAAVIKAVKLSFSKTHTTF